MPANDEVMSDVIESLWDSQVDSRTIAVAAEDGHVTLRGTVGSLREKREAGRVAARTFGVVSVRTSWTSAWARTAGATTTSSEPRSCGR
jgi:osmotically-inducible protein OsmY